MFAEAIRRSVWAVLRVENEFFNNYEQYRDIIAIPPFEDSDDEWCDIRII